MADVISFLVEIAFAASLIGFITIVVLIPTKKVIQAGGAGRIMDSPLVPILIGLGTGAAVVMFPLAILAASDTVRIAGIVTSAILLSGYIAIFFEHRSMKRLLGATLPPLEHALTTGTEGQGQAMTVECPRCAKHLTVAYGARMITCPHCGLAGSL